MKTYFCLLASVGVLGVGCLSARAEALDSSQFAWGIEFVASGYDGGSTLENFPVLVRLSEKDIEGFRYADIGSTTNAAYASLRFADEDGNNLDYEIEEWNVAGMSAVWVSLPALSGRATKFHARYVPNAQAVLPAVHPTNVWTSAGYVGVWHMNERVADSTWKYVYQDATGRGSHGHSDNPADTWYMNKAIDTAPQANGTPYYPTATPSNGKHIIVSENTADWNLSVTGFSTEAWVKSPSHNWVTLLSTGSGGGVGTNALTMSQSTGKLTLFTSTGKSTSSDLFPTNGWNFLTAVWPGAGTASPFSRLYMAPSGEESPSVWAEAAGAACDLDGGSFGITGANTGAGSRVHDMDEVRVRRGLSTPDWIQATYDVQRVGTDFLEAGIVHRIGDPVITAVGENTATAALDFSLARFGDSAKALFVNFATKATNIVDVADLENPSATASGLAADTDYDVCFVVENDGEVARETAFTSFTTAGRADLNPKSYRCSVTFTASGYDGTETLEHFPVLVRLSETAVPGFSYTGVDPADIRFTAADGELLAHEVETWDSTGTSVIWVALPELSGTDTSFTMYWRPLSNAGVPAQPAYRVWKYAGYVGVWHLSSIVKNQSEAYLAYNAPLWGQVFPDSAGCGANATKGTTTWNTSLQNAPGERFSESLGRANGTLGANGYCPFLVPPTSEGGGAGDWSFSTTGYSTEAWVFPSRDQHNILVSGKSAGTTSDGLIYAATNGVRLCAGDWGGSTVPWSLDNADESFWHFVTAVWTPSTSSDPSVLYGTSGDGAPTKLVERSGKHATDQCATDGMLLVGGSGADFGLDEIRVRRGLSSKDWIQANWDTQRLGTDFLTAGEVKVRNPAFIIVVR